MAYLEQTSINRDLVLDFFLVLSRMEFALKLAGYAKGDEKNVSPDWIKFGKDISLSFDSKADQTVSKALQYYLSIPPDKQVLKDGRLDWVSAVPTDETEIERTLILIRRVRNNLFHGGKYNAQAHSETARNEELLKMGICVLKQAMQILPNVQAAYDGASI